MSYDSRLQLNPGEALNAAAYDTAEVEWGLKVIMSTGFLKVGPSLVPLPKWLLVALVRMGVEQVEGDSPVYRRFYNLGFWWTLCILLALRQLYVTLRDWRSFQDDNRPWMGLSREDRSKFAWRVIGLSIALSTLPLWYRRWDFLSNRVKDFEERTADAVARIFPAVLFWTTGWTYAFGPIVGSGTEFVASRLNRRELQWDDTAFDVLDYNGSRILQGIGAASTMGWCVHRQRSQAVPFKFCGRSATIGIVVGRTLGWLFSFALVGRQRRAQLKQKTTVKADVNQPVNQLAQLQQEVEQLRQALASSKS